MKTKIKSKQNKQNLELAIEIIFFRYTRSDLNQTIAVRNFLFI
jgi:hypothetical protein